MEKTALKKPFDKVVSLVKEVSLPKGEKPEPGSDPNKKLSDQQEKVRQLSVYQLKMEGVKRATGSRITS